jgi:autotransporter-associated beta strand protein
VHTIRARGIVANRRRLVVVGLLVLAAALWPAAFVARAQTSYTWLNNNGTSSNPGFWNTAANWSSNPSLPAFDANTQLYFASSLTQTSPTFTMTNSAGPTMLVNQMTFALDGYPFVPAANTNAAATLNVGDSSSNTSFLTLAASPSNVEPSIVQNGNGSVLLQSNGGFGQVQIQAIKALQFNGTGLGAVRIDAGIFSANSGTNGITIANDPSAVKAFSSGATTILAGTNSFFGNVTLNTGNLALGSSTALGDASNQFIINPGANSLRFVSPATATAPITIANPVVLNGTMLISSSDAGAANFTGGISGVGGITLNNLLNFSSGFTNPNVNIQSPATFSGPIIVKPMFGGQGIGGANMVTVSSNATTNTNGSLATTNIQLYPSGYLSLNNTVANQTRLAPNTTITSNRGFVGLFANASVGASETIGTLNAGGMTSLYAIPALGPGTLNPGSGAQITVTTLNRPLNGTLEFRGPNLGGTPGVNVANFYVTNNPGGATPGSTTPGTQNLAVLPYAYSNAVAGTSNTTTPNIGLVRYDSGSHQIVPLNNNNGEYAYAPTLAAGTTPGLNYYISGGGNAGVVANNSTTINGLLLVADTSNAISPSTFGSIGGSATLNVTGPIVMTGIGSNVPSSANGAFMPGQIAVGGLAFGANTAYVHAAWPLGGVAYNYIASPMSGTGGFVKSGQSDVILYATNSISGGMTINAGNIVFDSDSQLGAAGGSITLNSGNGDGLYYAPNTRFGTNNPTGMTLSRPIVLGAGGGTLTVTAGSAPLTYTGPLSGTGSLFKSGVGTVFLNPSSNTATGDVVVGNGTLVPASDAALGDSGNRVILNGGIFQPGGFKTTNRDFLNGSVNPGIIYTPGGDFTINGVLAQQLFSQSIGNLAGFIKIGAGNLTLTNSSTVTGAVTIGEGTTSSISARYTTPAAVVAGGSLTLSGARGAMALASGFTVNDGASLVLDNSGPAGNINNDRVGTVPVSLAATSGLTLIGNANASVSELVGQIQTANSSNYPGGAQTVTVTQPASGGAGQVTTLATLGVVSGSSSTSGPSPLGVLFVRGTNLGASSGDRGQFLVNVDLPSASGVSVGVVAAASPTSGPTDFATTVAAGSQFSVVPLKTYGSIGFPGAGVVADQPMTTAQLSANTVLNGLRIRDGGGVDLNGKTLTLGDAASPTAQTGMILSTGTANAGIIDSATGGTIEFGAAAARIVTPTDLTIGSATNPVALQQTNSSTSASATAFLVKSGAGTLTLYGVPTTAAGTSGTTIGSFLNSTATTRNTDQVFVGEGKLVLGNQYALGRSYTASPSGNPNGVLPSVVISAGATLDINSQSLVFFPVVGAGTLALGSGSVNMITNSSLSFTGQITGTAASTYAVGYPQGSGTSYSSGNVPNLSGDDSGFFGAFKIYQGGLQFRSANALVNNNPIQLGDTLSPSSLSKSTNLSFTDVGTSYTTDITVPAMSTQGTGTVGKSMIYGSLTTGGFVTLNGSITLGRTAAVGTAASNGRNGMFTIASKITGPGQLIVNPNYNPISTQGGNIAFTNPLNDYQGGTLLFAANGNGTNTTGVNAIVAVGADTVFSTGPITLDDQPGVLRADNGARNLANQIILSPSNTTLTTKPVQFGFVGTNDFTLSGAMSASLASPPASATVANLVVDQYSLGNATLSGPITNGSQANLSLAMTKNGPGTLVVSNPNNTFSGGFTFNAGTLGIGANNALGTGALTLNGGTFKSVGGNFAIGNTPISGAGGIILEGTNTLTVNGASTAAGTNLVNSGTLKIGNATTLGAPTNVVVNTVGVAANTTVANGAVLDLNGQQTVNEPIILNGSGIGGNGVLINSAAGTVARIGSAVSSLTINSLTGDFSAGATFGITGGGGSGATAAANFGLTQAGINLASGGAYTTTAAPTVSISAPGGGGTTATATVTYNSTLKLVTGLTLTNPGSGYTTVPTITFNGGGAGSTPAQATYNNGTFQLLNVTLTAPGTGYTSAPSAVFSSGTSSVTANASSVTLATTSSIGGDGDIIIDGQVLGSGGLVKVGNGTVTLNGGANTYAGGTNVSAGTLVAASDGALGTGNVTGTAVATLTFNGSTTTTKNFAMGNGTITVANGQTVTFNGSQVSSAYLDGPGSYATGANGAQFINVNTTQATAITSNSAADIFRNVSNSAALTVAAGVNSAGTSSTVTFNNLTNQGLGSVTIGANTQVNESNFQTYGTLTINPATVTGNFSQTTLMTNVGTSQLGFNGGSRTFIGTPATAVFPQSWPDSSQRGLPTFVAGIDLKGKNAVVSSGLLVNNGYVEDSTNNFQGTAAIIADFGSLVKGAGYFQNTVQTINGGKFQAGNSPGSASFGKFVFGPGGVSNYVFAIDDATGAAGPSPDAAGHVSGWGLVKAINHLVGGTLTSGDFTWTATPSSPLTVAIDTLVNPTTVGVDIPGPMADFDPNRAYSWPAFDWAGSYAGPTDAAVLNASTAFDLTGVHNQVAGTFGWSFDGGDHTLSLTYSPSAVPEPGTLALTGLGGLAAGWIARRRRLKAAKS